MQNHLLKIIQDNIIFFSIVLFAISGNISNKSVARTVEYTQHFSINTNLVYTTQYSLTSAGDVDSDGITDIIQGLNTDNFGQNDGGEAHVYSGATGEVIHYYGRLPYHSWLGTAVSGLGDVDADGFDDYGVSVLGDITPGNSFVSSKVLVFSGATGGVLHLLENQAEWIAKVGDVNQDGKDDILTRTRYNGGVTNVFSGATGVPLFSFPGSYLEDGDILEDLDGDNVSDLVVGSYSEAKIVSSIDGSVLFSLPDYKYYTKGIFDAGDLNQDGTSDLVLGTGTRSDSFSEINLLSGEDGSIFQTLVISGSAISEVGDVNNDGFIDLLVGRTWEENYFADEVGSARIYSGFDGAVLHTSFGSPYSSYGSDLGPLGDLNGDGVTDFYVGAASPYTGSSFFRVYVSNVIPEPSTLSLIGLALTGLLVRRRC